MTLFKKWSLLLLILAALVGCVKADKGANVVSEDVALGLFGHTKDLTPLNNMASWLAPLARISTSACDEDCRDEAIATVASL